MTRNQRDGMLLILASVTGYAMLPVAHTELGTQLTVDIPGIGEQAARVVERPFVDPDKAIPKT